MAGGGVARQPPVVVVAAMGQAAGAAAAGPAPLVQRVHVQFQGVTGADVGLAVLLLLWSREDTRNMPAQKATLKNRYYTTRCDSIK